MSAHGRRPMPTWFVILVALVYGLLLRLEPALAPGGDPHVRYAWFAWLILAAQAIWTGVQIAAKVTLTILAYAVQALWATVQLFYNTAREIGQAAIHGFQTTWKFLRTTFDTILWPGWVKFWTWIDRARIWLDAFFRPAFEFLRFVRDEILGFYDKWVRPIMDTIGIARKVLDVLYSLGLDWAKKLDQELARIEDKINEPFLFALRQINLVIGVLDRIVTADGLFQRLALVRSLERDVRYVSRAFVNWRSHPVDASMIGDIKAHVNQRTFRDVTRDTEEALLTGGGRYGPIVSEAVAQWRLYLDGRAP